MTRIPPASPPYDPRVAEDFAALMPPGIEPLNLFRTLAKNPRVLRRIRRGGLLDPGSITVRQREIAILRTTARAQAEYEWGVHVAFFAKPAQLTDAHVYATVWHGPDAPCWAADESLILRMCDELHDTARITDATWTELHRTFAEDQLIELLVLAGLYRTISYVANGTGLALEPLAPRFPEREATPTATHSGSCLCRRIRYAIDGELGAFGYCHCTSCRKASGSTHGANAPVDRARFRFLASAPLREYESSPGKIRAFCGECGSPIYAYLRSSPDVLRIRLGSLDTPFAERPRAHTFVAERPEWAPIDDAIPQFDAWAPKAVLDQRGSRQRDA